VPRFYGGGDPKHTDPRGRGETKAENTGPTAKARIAAGERRRGNLKRGERESVTKSPQTKKAKKKILLAGVVENRKVARKKAVEEKKGRWKKTVITAETEKKEIVRESGDLRAPKKKRAVYQRKGSTEGKKSNGEKSKRMH